MVTKINDLSVKIRPAGFWCQARKELEGCRKRGKPLLQEENSVENRKVRFFAPETYNRDN
jgi:hypothetical protein